MYRKLIYCIFVLTLFGFKLSLVGRSSDDGGGGGGLLSAIRIDDLTLVIFILFYIFTGGKLKIFFSKKPVLIFGFYLLISIISTIYSSIIGNIGLINGLLFSIRPLEYFMYCYLGYELARKRINLGTTFKIYILYCLILIFVQRLGIISGLSNFSFNRAIANTGGPWELAAVSALLLCFFFQKRDIVFSMLAFIILILTQSRITLVATIIVIIFANTKNVIGFFKKDKVIISSLVLVFVGLSYIAYAQMLNESNKKEIVIPDVVARMGEFISTDTLTNVESIFIYTKPATSQQNYVDKTYGASLNKMLSRSNTGDVSSTIRFTRWSILIKTACDNSVSFLIGLGPSYAGKAIDGNYVRLFVETGIIGLSLYLMFSFSILIYVKDAIIRNYMTILIITALFIDIFVTQKAMFLFWLLYGYYYFISENYNNSLKQ